MQKHKTGINNLESPNLRANGANPMSRKHRKSFIALSLMAIFVFASAGVLKRPISASPSH